MNTLVAPQRPAAAPQQPSSDPAAPDAATADAADATTAEDLRVAALVADAKILIVDDEAVNVRVVRRLLELEGFRNFATATDPTEVMALIASERPDAVLLDLMMPELSGMDLLGRIRTQRRLRLLPVLILTAVTDRERRVEALRAGATDLLTKPIDASELVSRLRNCLLAKAYQDGLEGEAERLAAAVRRRTDELDRSCRAAIHCLARAAEFRDDDTGRHVLRVGRYARLLGATQGIHGDELDHLELAAQLHDVGKIGIPDAVLLKPGKLTEEEFEVVRHHCGYGKRILQPIDPDEARTLAAHTSIGADILLAGQNTASAPLIRTAVQIALTHHERWDGAGYPLGLAGADIPLEGRIVAVCDVFDALSTRRVYKPAFPLDKCWQIMAEERGKHFDPDLLDAFFDRRAEIIRVQLSYADDE